MPPASDRRTPRAAVARALALPLAALLALVLLVLLGVHVAGGARAVGSDGGSPVGLTPELARRFAEAQEAAAADGVALEITSGWRSADRQQQLFDDAVRRYGSADAARRWVLPPADSAHVHGAALDVGPADGATWLEERGSAFGLCRVYVNEPWHFEPLVEPGTPCPALLPDAAA